MSYFFEALRIFVIMNDIQQIFDRPLENIGRFRPGVSRWATEGEVNLEDDAELARLNLFLKYIGNTEAGDQIHSIFDVVRDYTYALDTLDGYDYQNLEIKNTSSKETFHATYENAIEVINGLKAKFGESSLFGHEKDDSFRSSIGQIYQTWDGQDLYPSVEEKAAVLLW